MRRITNDLGCKNTWGREYHHPTTESLDPSFPQQRRIYSFNFCMRKESLWWTSSWQSSTWGSTTLHLSGYSWADINFNFLNGRLFELTPSLQYEQTREYPPSIRVKLTRGQIQVTQHFKKVGLKGQSNFWLETFKMQGHVAFGARLGTLPFPGMTRGMSSGIW